MTLTIQLDEDQEQWIVRQAALRGLEPAEYLLELAEEDALLQEFEPIPVGDETDREEAIAGVQRGIEASDRGRNKPIEVAVAEARAKHHLPDSWAKK